MLTQWNALGFDDLDRGFAALDGLRQEMDRVFQRFGVDWSASSPLWQSLVEDASWPRVQISDQGDELHMYAELPGFAPDDLQISLEQGTLTLSGERKDDMPEGYSVHRRERGGTMRFSRSFALPARVEPDAVEAKLSNGILALRMPKVAADRRRSIDVKAA